MRIDISRILSGETDTLSFDVSFEAGEDEGYGYFAEWGIDFTDKISVKGAFYNNGGYMSLQATASTSYDTLCARCLKAMHKTFEHSFEKSVASELTNEENDDFVLTEGGCVDVSALVCEEFLLSFPLKELCDELCKGLCQKCGKNLNGGECGCQSDTDPRMAKLKALLSEYD